MFLENRRILEVIRSIEQQALAFRNSPPSGTIAELDDLAPAVELPLERPLFAPPFVARLTQQLLEVGEEDVAADGLFEQVAVDRARLRTNIQHLLQGQERITLAEVVAQHPLQHGLAELVSYIAVASENRKSVFDEQSSQRIEWNDRRGQTRSVTIPLVVFTR